MADIPPELVEQIARRDVVLFVGTGLSIGAGLPSWDELLTPLADSIGLPDTLCADPLKVAQHYENQRGRQALVDHIIQQTDTTGKGPTDNHRRLLRLGASTLVTTNYDDLVERALRESNERFTKVVRDQDLPYIRADAVTLVKLHGDREQPDTIIITQQDYYTYFRRFPRIKDKLTGLLLEKTFLFVGYSINDPDFNQIQAEIAFDLQQHQRMAYAVLFDVDEFTLSDLRSRNIHVLNIPPNRQPSHSERLGDLLDELIRQVDQHRRQKVPTVHSVTVPPTPPETEDVRGLLEAMGYRITDTKAIGPDLYFLSDAKWGAEIRQEVVLFVGRKPMAGDAAALNDAVVSYDAARGTLLTRQPLPIALCDLASQREHIQCYTLDEFTDRLADFRPYLERLIQKHESSEIPAFYVPLAVESEADEDQTPQVFKPLTSLVDAWLGEPGRNHLSILGGFGSGKTWFCQRYAYLAAKRYLADPAHNRVPVLITLRDYSRAYDVEQLITDAVANRYKVGLAAGYKTFDRLNEAGRLLTIIDGFDDEKDHYDYDIRTKSFLRRDAKGYYEFAHRSFVEYLVETKLHDMMRKFTFGEIEGLPKNIPENAEVYNFLFEMSAPDYQVLRQYYSAALRKQASDSKMKIMFLADSAGEVGLVKLILSRTSNKPFELILLDAESIRRDLVVGRIIVEAPSVLLTHTTPGLLSEDDVEDIITMVRQLLGPDYPKIGLVTAAGGGVASIFIKKIECIDILTVPYGPGELIEFLERLTNIVTLPNQ